MLFWDSVGVGIFLLVVVFCALFGLYASVRLFSFAVEKFSDSAKKP